MSRRLVEPESPTDQGIDHVAVGHFSIEIALATAIREQRWPEALAIALERR